MSLFMFLLWNLVKYVIMTAKNQEKSIFYKKQLCVKKKLRYKSKVLQITSG
jgi:hypothetical protein